MCATLLWKNAYWKMCAVEATRGWLKSAVQFLKVVFMNVCYTNIKSLLIKLKINLFEKIYWIFIFATRVSKCKRCYFTFNYFSNTFCYFESN